MEGNAEALVDIGARVTNIAVHQGGVPRFVRVLLMGGADITDAVASGWAFRWSRRRGSSSSSAFR